MAKRKATLENVDSDEDYCPSDSESEVDWSSSDESGDWLEYFCNQTTFHFYDFILE